MHATVQDLLNYPGPSKVPCDFGCMMGCSGIINCGDLNSRRCYWKVFNKQIEQKYFFNNKKSTLLAWVAREREKKKNLSSNFFSSTDTHLYKNKHTHTHKLTNTHALSRACAHTPTATSFPFFAGHLSMFHITWKSWSQFCVVPAPGVGWECVKLLWRSAATARLNYLFAFSVSKLYTFVDGETPASCYKMAILHSVLKCSTSVFLDCDSLSLSPFFSFSLSRPLPVNEGLRSCLLQVRRHISQMKNQQPGRQM